MGSRNAEALAAKVVETAESQHTAVAWERAVARTVRTLVGEIVPLNEKVAEVERRIAELVSLGQHPMVGLWVPGKTSPEVSR
ncbi:hypothetical protein [Streptomyces sp. NPDC096033]|uniref:hypothetical protein n=1 Tax=Streptomyces sp. NPDC096033 TaxID=3366071 RepID=UPI00380F24D9